MSSTLLPQLSLPQVDSLRQSLARKVALCIAASLFVAICAHISMPMPFTPVPVTLQTFAVILVGLVLGPVQGFAAMALYLAEGATGLPVFSPQGPGGLLQLLGPTAGYLFAYPIAAATAGALVSTTRRFLPSFPAALLAGALALCPIFGLGAAWLGYVMGLNAAHAIAFAITPFLLGEVFKLLAAAAAYTALTIRRTS